MGAPLVEVTVPVMVPVSLSSVSWANTADIRDNASRRDKKEVRSKNRPPWVRCDTIFMGELSESPELRCD
jgi:hypothetical protein